MTECVQFFNADGTRVEKFPIFAPQYKVVQFMDRHYKWYRLRKEGGYEELGEGTYMAAVYGVLSDCRRVNAKKIKINWNTCPDVADASVMYEHDLKKGPVGTCMYLTIEAKPCQTTWVAAWKLVKEEYSDRFGVYRQLDAGVWVKVFEDQLYSCRKFTEDQLQGVRERLIELYRCKRGIELYSFVAMLSKYNTADLLGDTTLFEVVEGAINYTRSWTTKAIRIGTKCIAPNGRSTLLARPKGCHIEWTVTQLESLCRLELGEVAFLVDKELLSPAMTGNEVWQVVKGYLTDPERNLMREYHAAVAEGLA